MSLNLSRLGPAVQIYVYTCGDQRTRSYCRQLKHRFIPSETLQSGSVVTNTLNKCKPSQDKLWKIIVCRVQTFTKWLTDVNATYPLSACCAGVCEQAVYYWLFWLAARQWRVDLGTTACHMFDSRMGLTENAGYISCQNTPRLQTEQCPAFEFWSDHHLVQIV